MRQAPRAGRFFPDQRRSSARRERSRCPRGVRGRGWGRNRGGGAFVAEAGRHAPDELALPYPLEVGGELLDFLRGGNKRWTTTAVPVLQQ